MYTAKWATASDLSDIIMICKWKSDTTNVFIMSLWRLRSASGVLFSESSRFVNMHASVADADTNSGASMTTRLYLAWFYSLCPDCCPILSCLLVYFYSWNFHFTCSFWIQYPARVLSKLCWTCSRLPLHFLFFDVAFCLFLPVVCLAWYSM